MDPDAAKAIEDPETVFLLLSQIFFPPLVAGFVLAAVLAAIMSTMSSQLVVCSSALVEDLVNITGRKASDKALLVYGRVGVQASADMAAAARGLAARFPYVDASRVGIWGWSGGGSQTLNSLFRYPDVFSLGMAVAPVPDGIPSLASRPVPAGTTRSWSPVAA